MTSIEKEFSKIWDEKQERFGRQFRENCGLIIGTSFSMIIFLLSFTEKKTNIFDLGILNLTLSLILLFTLFLKSTSIVFYEDDFEKYINDFLNKNFYYEFFSHHGLNFFFLGLAFIFTFFNLIIIVIIIFCFLLLYQLFSILNTIKFLKGEKKFIIFDKDLTPIFKKYGKLEVLDEIIICFIILLESYLLVSLYFK